MRSQGIQLGYRMLKLITLLLLGALLGPSDSIVIKSPVVTNFGDWYNMEYCPADMYAVGIQVKIEEEQQRGDDTALNGIALFCQPLNTGK